jgi:hypothetical protein
MGKERRRSHPPVNLVLNAESLVWFPTHSTAKPALAPICTTLRSSCAFAMIITLPEKLLLNFRVDAMEPLFSALGLLLVSRGLGLEPGNPSFGGAKLVRPFCAVSIACLLFCSATSAALLRSWRIV